MVRLLLFPFLVTLLGFQSLCDLSTDYSPDLLTPYELSKLTDIYYQFCPTNKCDNTTHVPEVNILKPNVSICCYPQCSCETPTCSYDILHSKSCCPELLNELNSYPTCVNAQPKPWNPRKPIYEAFDMESTCTSRSNIGYETADRCEFGFRFNELDTKVPVADRSFTRIFANRYCAKCYILDYVPWKPIIQCEKGSFEISPIENIVERVQQSEFCTLYFEHPNVQKLGVFERPGGQKLDSLYSCGRYISECNMTGNWKTYDSALESGCRAMYAPFQYRYRNVFCYLCNTDDSLKDMPTCSMPPYMFSSVSLTLTYPVTYHVSREEMNATACGQNGLYDPFQDSCLEIRCLLYKIYIGDGQCQRMVERMSGNGLLVFLKFTPQSFVKSVSSLMNDILMRLTKYIEIMWRTISDTALFKLASGHRKMPGTDESNMENIIDYFLVIYAIHFPFLSPSGMVKVSSIDELLKFHGYNMSVEGPENERIPFVIKLDTVDLALESDDIARYKSVSADAYDYLSPEMETLLPVHDCPHVELDLSVYNLTNGQLGVMNEAFSITIGRNEYLMTNNGSSILTCVDIYQSLVTESVMAQKPSAEAASLTLTFSRYVLACIFCVKLAHLF